MNRLEYRDKCIPRDYREWRSLGIILYDNNIPCYKNYGETGYDTYSSWPAFSWSEKEHVTGSSTKTDGYNIMSVDEFLHKAGLSTSPYYKGGPITHKFI